MMQDVHRNALVTIFLRMLEYFNGILFLTTNRVMSFDPAFQSRIHMALKVSLLSLRLGQLNRILKISVVSGTRRQSPP